MSERVLVFPNDMSVGHLFVTHNGVESNRPARGRVAVPEGARVWLSADSPLRGLYSLAPDDLYGIGLVKKKGNDADLRNLAHLTGLKRLYCSKSHDITDVGVASISGLRSLVDLDLYWTKITDAALSTIGQMHRLTHLHLGFTQVKGPGLVYLARLQRLARFSLEDTKVDDSAVPVLATLSSLQNLTLWETQITTRGLARLREALPNCSVVLPHPKPGYMAPETVRAILLGRVQAALRARGHVGIDINRELLFDCAITEWRDGAGVIKVPVGRTRWPVLKALDALARFRAGIDLHVVGPAGIDVWIPWLRSRGEERRKVSRKAVA
jgi:hypothetical protein